MSDLTCPGCGAILNAEIVLSVTSNGERWRGSTLKRKLILASVMLLIAAALCVVLYLR